MTKKKIIGFSELPITDKAVDWIIKQTARKEVPKPQEKREFTIENGIFKVKPQDSWEEKLVNLVEKELTKCPQKKGDCYMNDILGLVRKLIKEATFSGYEIGALDLSDKRAEARDNGYEEGARMQAKMDVDVIKEARQEERSKVIKEIYGWVRWNAEGNIAGSWIDMKDLLAKLSDFKK